MAVVTFFHASPGKVTVQVRARRLPPGCHGFHVHAIGVCDPATGFTSAGGHVNPTGGAHDDHAATCPSCWSTRDGTAQATVAIDRFSIDQLLDADGSAMVVHAAADNYANIPTRYHSHDFLAEQGKQESVLVKDFASSPQRPKERSLPLRVS